MSLRFLRLLLVIVFAFAASLQIAAAQTPANTLWQNAVALEGVNGSISGDFAGITPVPSSRFGDSGMALWYRWTAPKDGFVVFRTPPGTDTTLAVFPTIFPEGYSLKQAGRTVDDAWCEVAIECRRGTTNLIRVALQETTSLPTTFAIEWESAPDIIRIHDHGVGNELDGYAKVLIDTSMKRATGFKMSVGDLPLKSYTVPPAGNRGLLNYVRVPIPNNTVLDGLHELPLNVRYSTKEFCVFGRKGMRVRIRDDEDSPANDDYRKATPLYGASGRIRGTLVGADDGAGDTDSRGILQGFPGGKIVWYEWTAPASGAFRFATDFGVVISSYSFSSHDSSLLVEAKAGRKYVLGVGASTEAGFELEWRSLPAGIVRFAKLKKDALFDYPDSTGEVFGTEKDGFAEVHFKRFGTEAPLECELLIDLFTRDTEGGDDRTSIASAADLPSRSFTVRFAEGQTETSVRIPITDDDLSETYENAALKLVVANPNAEIAGPNDVPLKIADNEPGVMNFAAHLPQVSIVENEIVKGDFYGVPSFEGSPVHRELWYVWKTPGAGVAEARLLRTDLPMSIAVHRANGLSIVVPNSQSVKWEATPGESVSICVTMLVPAVLPDDGPYGFQFNVTCADAPRFAPNEGNRFAFARSSYWAAPGEPIKVSIYRFGEFSAAADVAIAVSPERTVPVHFDVGQTTAEVELRDFADGANLQIVAASAGELSPALGFISASVLRTVAPAAQPFSADRTIRFAGILSSDANRPPFWMTLRATKAGVFSSTIRQGSWTVRFTGEFSAEGSAENAAPDGTRVFIRYQNDQFVVTLLRNGERVASGGIFVSDDGDLATVRPGPVSFFTDESTVTSAIAYSTHVDGSTIGRLVVGNTGTVAAVGYAADGSPFSAGGQIGRAGDFSLYSPLYRGTGFLVFRMIMNKALYDEALLGDFDWVRPGIPGSKPFELGFQVGASVHGDYYVPPPPASDFATSVFRPNSATPKLFNSVTYLRPRGFNCAVAFGDDSTSDYPGLKLVFNPATGWFKGSTKSISHEYANGSFEPIRVRTVTPIRGILIGRSPATYKGYGFMLPQNRSERVRIEWEFY